MIFIETLSFRVKTDTPSRVKLDKVAGRTFHTSAVRVGEAGHFFDSNLSHAFISLPGREGAHDFSQLTKNHSAGKPDSALPVAQSSPFPRETRAQDRLYPNPFSQGSHSHHRAGAHPSSLWSHALQCRNSRQHSPAALRQHPFMLLSRGRPDSFARSHRARAEGTSFVAPVSLALRTIQP